MNFEIEKSFEKDYRKLKNPALTEDLTQVIYRVSKAETIKAIPHLKKLSGYKNAYRIKCKTYRIGIIIENETIIFVAFAHRKDIYKKFP